MSFASSDLFYGYHALKRGQCRQKLSVLAAHRQADRQQGVYLRNVLVLLLVQLHLVDPHLLALEETQNAAEVFYVVDLDIYRHVHGL